MNRSHLIVTLAVGVAGLLAPFARAQDNKDLALQARAVLKQHCYHCHHGDGSKGGEFDAVKDTTLTAKRDDGEKPYVIPGKPDESFLLERLEKGSMPPKTVKERPSAEDKAVMRKWIAAGAPSFPSETRTNLTQKMALAMMRDHLRKAESEDRPFLRFFTLHHLHNNPRVMDCLARNLYRYATGHVETPGEEPAVLQIAQGFKDGSIS